MTPAESARALAISCRDSSSYQDSPPGSTFRELVDDVLVQTQHVSDQAVDGILIELAKGTSEEFRFVDTYQGPQARRIARDLHRAMNPGGMHTNGPTTVLVDASHLYILLNRWRREQS